jgi:hypothetical protein
MEATCSSETSVDFYRITVPYITEDIALHKHRCGNLKTCGSRLTLQENQKKLAPTLFIRLRSGFIAKHVAEILISQRSLCKNQNQSVISELSYLVLLILSFVTALKATLSTFVSIIKT